MLPPNFPSPLSDVSKANATSSTNESAKEKELILEEFKDVLVDTLDEGAGPMLGKPMDIELVDGKNQNHYALTQLVRPQFTSRRRQKTFWMA